MAVNPAEAHREHDRDGQARKRQPPAAFQPERQEQRSRQGGTEREARDPTDLEDGEACRSAVPGCVVRVAGGLRVERGHPDAADGYGQPDPGVAGEEDGGAETQAR